MLGVETANLLENERAEGVLSTPPPTLTTTRMERAMANDFPTAKMDQAKGAQGEMIAAAWLCGLNYHVFRNVGPIGPADLIAWDPITRDCAMIDVKHFSEASTYIYSDGRVCIPIRTVARSDVHRLIVVDCAVAGFYRPLGNRKGGEFYWPLQCEEVPVTFKPTAKTYKECLMFSGNGAGHAKNAATWER